MEMVKCEVCNGTGYIPDAEPIEFMDDMGNQQIRFSTTKMNCPNPFCKNGFISKEDLPKE